MTMTETPTATATRTPEPDRRPSSEPTGAGLGVWVITSFIALLALVVSIAALVVSVNHQTKTTAAAPAPAPAAPSAPRAAPGTNTVHLSEYKVDVGSSTFSPGQHTFTIANDGKTEHELLVFHTSIDPTVFPLDQEGNINEDAAGMNKVSDGDNIAPGATQTRTVDLTQPGTYVFVCNLPGHFKAGMYQTITVQ
ncbi:MAG: hypothetical protein JO075_04305 [Acidimicrobiia bacterium]|nr:hypothetical protein [Acidimicrobiia bacterium]